MARNNSNQCRRLTGMLLIGLLVVGCAHSPSHSNLAKAKGAYAKATEQPSITKQAPNLLHRAESLIAKADTSMNNDLQGHLGYLAWRSVQLAQIQASARTAETTLASLEAARLQLSLAHREIANKRAKQELRSLMSSLPPTRAKIREHALTLDFSENMYAHRSPQLSSRALALIKPIARFLRTHLDWSVTIGRGSSPSERMRSANIRKSLIARGIEPARLMVIPGKAARLTILQ